MANDDNDGKPVYRGPERRKFARRLLADRRSQIRWEPDSPARRQGPGRRATDHLGTLGAKR